MITLEEIYEQDPTQRIIDEGADFGAKEIPKAGIPIFYRDDEYPETLSGNPFIKGYTSGAKFLVRKELTPDHRLLEERIKALNAK